jgi:hypothetical protein
LQAAVAADPPPVTYPEPVPHCDVCVYWQHCEQQRRRDDHLSLVAGLGRSHQRELAQQQIGTLTALAQCRGELPAEPARGSRDTFRKLGHQAALQLEARTTRPIPYAFLDAEKGCGLARLPEPSPGDVFLDFEGDPFVGQSGLEYLTGYACAGADGAVVYEQIWALDHAAEKVAVATFLDFLEARLRAHPDLHIYHFGAYEPSALRRLCARHDTHGAVLDQFLRGERFVDLHTVVREALRIGIEGYGLKELEKVIGFPRQLDLRVAGVARRDLELHLELGRRAQITTPLQQQVAEYNRDDCLATAHLRDWLEQQRAAVIAAGSAMQRPALGAPEAKPEVREREARILALRQALMEGLPEAEQRNDEQRGKALLADLVGYFQRETKSAYWEHFRLRELPAEERFGERELLAGLRFVGLMPKVGKETNPRLAYDFPPQETALDVGDDVYVVRDDDPKPDGVGTRLGEIVEHDLSAGRVVIKQTKATATLHPGAIFRDQVVGNEALEAGILEFAEHVREHGFGRNETFATALDLLLRRKPQRVAKGPDGTLRAEGESTRAAALRLCTQMGGGVLPIQGPPGTGKSFTGGHTLVGLAQAGFRVGVTAVSHQVIDNLLGKVHEVATKTGAAIRLVHKHDQDPPAGIEYVENGDEALGAINPDAVVGGTAWLWAHPKAIQKLDYLFVDEAGQMSLARCCRCPRTSQEPRAARRSACSSNSPTAARTPTAPTSPPSRT